MFTVKGTGMDSYQGLYMIPSPGPGLAPTSHALPGATLTTRPLPTPSDYDDTSPTAFNIDHHAYEGLDTQSPYIEGITRTVPKEVASASEYETIPYEETSFYVNSDLKTLSKEH